MVATLVLRKPHPAAEGTAMKSSRQNHAVPHAAVLGRRDVPSHSLEENLRHHSLIFVIEEVAVKDRHAPDYRVGEVHNDVDGAAIRNVDGVQPHWIGNRLVVFGV